MDTRPSFDEVRGVLVTFQADVEAPPEEVDLLSRRLRAELTQLDVEAVTQVPGEQGAPAGAKGDPAMWTSMLVSLSAAGGVFTSLLALLQDWLGRQGASHRISVTIDGDTIELDRASATERRELIDAYVQRHTSG